MTVSSKAKFEATANKFKTMIENDLTEYLSGDDFEELIEGLTEDAHYCAANKYCWDTHPLLNELLVDIADGNAKVKVSVDISYED